MAINIIERAITPYNRSANKLTQKQGYSLYAPTVTKGKPGIATFSEEDFDVSGGKVGLKSSLKFIRLNYKNGVDNVPASECIFEVDGRKTPGIIYQNFVYEVASGFNTEPYLCSGYLFVTLNVDQDISGFINQTEVFFADGLMWTRLLRFEPDWTISGGVNSFELVRIPSWAKRDTKPQYTPGEVGAVSTQTFYESMENEQKAREDGDAAVNERITNEISAREAGDTAVNNRLTTELSSLETRMGEALQSYLSITQAADNEIKDLAVGIPTYDETTGKITFETLSGRYTTIDLILMSMLTNVRFDEANNEIVFSFRTHEGVESEVRVPLGDLTLPAWTTNVNTTNPEQLSVPPTTQAVKNAVNSINSAMLSRSDVQQMIDTSLGVIENGSY